MEVSTLLLAPAEENEFRKTAGLGQSALGNGRPQTPSPGRSILVGCFKFLGPVTDRTEPASGSFFPSPCKDRKDSSVSSLRLHLWEDINIEAAVCQSISVPENCQMSDVRCQRSLERRRTQV